MCNFNTTFRCAVLSHWFGSFLEGISAFILFLLLLLLLLKSTGLSKSIITTKSKIYVLDYVSQYYLEELE